MTNAEYFIDEANCVFQSDSRPHHPLGHVALNIFREREGLRPHYVGTLKSPLFRHTLAIDERPRSSRNRAIGSTESDGPRPFRQDRRTTLLQRRNSRALHQECSASGTTSVSVHFRGTFIVTVDAQKQLTARLANTQVNRRLLEGIALPKVPNREIRDSRPTRYHFSSIIGRPVVDNQPLKVAKRLPSEAVPNPRQSVRAIVGRREDREDKWKFITHFRWRTNFSKNFPVRYLRTRTAF